jgi:hypothetical protein
MLIFLPLFSRVYYRLFAACFRQILTCVSDASGHFRDVEDWRSNPLLRQALAFFSMDDKVK